MSEWVCFATLERSSSGPEVYIVADAPTRDDATAIVRRRISQDYGPVWSVTDFLISERITRLESS